MAKNKTTIILVEGLVIALIVIALITSISTETQLKTQKSFASGELHALTCVAGNVSETTLYNITNLPTGWKAEDCAITNMNITNATGGNGLTLTTDYTFSTTTGVVQFKNSTNTAKLCSIGTSNYTKYYYNYCSSDYLNSSWGRTLLDMTPGLIAIALLVVAVLVAYQILEKQGKDDD